jgi:hypothetical protein
MNLMDWTLDVQPHLIGIEVGADMVSRHVTALPCRANFPTFAEEQLEETRAKLLAALMTIEAAQEIYASKPLEADYAA